MNFSTNLKYYRENKKISRSKMAKCLGITPAAYGAYELGKREPNYDTLNNIASILNVSPNDLLGYKIDVSKNAGINRKKIVQCCQEILLALGEQYEPKK